MCVAPQWAWAWEVLILPTRDRVADRTVRTGRAPSPWAGSLPPGSSPRGPPAAALGRGTLVAGA